MSSRRSLLKSGLAAATGTRISELAALQISDLDFSNSIVSVTKSMDRKIVTAPKTPAGYRQVKVDSATMEMLKKFVGNRPASERIFSSRRGTPLTAGCVNEYYMKPICKRLGLTPATTPAWRHGRISILQQNRVPPDLILKWVGHTNLKVTAGYSHFPDNYQQEIVNKLK